MQRRAKTLHLMSSSKKFAKEYITFLFIFFYTYFIKRFVQSKLEEKGIIIIFSF